MSRLLSKVKLGLRRPSLVVRHLRGQDVNLRRDEIGLSEIARYLPADPVILEAGALDGGDTVRMSSTWPGARIYAFEPVPAAYSQLASRTAGNRAVFTDPRALSSQTGTAELHVSAYASGEFRPDSSSLLTPAKHLDMHPDVVFRESIRVPTVTLDDWSRSAGVSRVDFMWLDLQGMEMAVLLASPQFTRRTTAICIEVVTTELYQGCPLYPEVLDSMVTLGFEVAIERIASDVGNVLFVSDGSPQQGDPGIESATRS